ncbi:MAG: aldo/keto reductase, partial [Phenylobacterium sp.]|uniref:aldo/keto reductase n=1 Tax=Phenylobacterium sp. TaxID=1871053 RepID=UPI0027345E38
KVRYIGSSNLSGWYTMKSLAASDRIGLTRYASQQIQYSLLWRDAEDELLPLGLDQGVGALIWSPLASGYLSGKYRKPGENAATRLSGDALSTVDDERARAIVDVLDDIATTRGVSAAQVALNWVVRRAGVTSVIMGARTEAQLADNLAAARWSLNDAEMERLTTVSKPPRRYPYYHQATFGTARNPVPPLQAPLSL